MKMKFACLAAMAGLGGMVLAAGRPDYENPEVNSINRLPPRTYAMPLADEKAALTDALEPETPYAVSLNGEWKFRWTGDPKLRPLDFWEPDFDDAGWYAIDVPSCVELRGWGVPWYTNQKYPHADLSNPTNAAFATIRDRFSGQPDFNPVSSYRRTFTVPESWKGRRVILRFDGVGSAYYVWVNGHKVGYAEDSKLPSEFDVTPYLNAPTTNNQQPTTNCLAVEVYKWCDGSYLEDQDMTRYSGIFRDVTLWSMPKDGIWDFVVKADANGHLEVSMKDEVEVRGGGGQRMELSLYDAERRKIGDLHCQPQPSTSTYTLDVQSPTLWSPEKPYLYTLVLKKGDDIRMKRVGFKDVKVVGNTVLFNGKKLKYKGVNRHESDPENGRTVSRADMLRDIELLKQYNFNTVRTSHYPDHHLWYDLCDRYGICLMAEANVEAHEPGYRENGVGLFKEWELSIVERNERHVAFYRNHPSVTFWSVGNETGHGDCFRRAIAAIKAADPSRPVHWERGNVDADVDSTMYATVDWLDKRGQFGDGLVKEFANGYANRQTAGKPFFMCEYSHAMGNALGHYHEYWEVFDRYDSLLGGCIWDWVDQAVWKETDKIDPTTGKRERYLSYGGDFDEKPNDGPFNCNGVIDPERHVTAKLIEAGHVNRGLVVTRRADGSLELRNRFGFTWADEFDGSWELVENGTVARRGTFAPPHLAPLSKGTLEGLPDFNLQDGVETFLNVNFALKADTAWAKKGWLVARNQVKLGGAYCDEPAAAATAPQEGADGTIVLSAGGTRAVLSRTTGTLCELVMDGRTVLKDPAEGLVAGPRLSWMRAFTDNDVWLFSESSWHAGWGRLIPSGLTQPRYHVKSVSVQGQSVRTVVEITGMKSAGFLHETVWTLGKDGVLRMENAVTPFGTMPPSIPRLGLSLKLDKALDDVQWYGRGPRENYVDRCTGSFVGLWSSTVDGLAEFYVRPQDNGFRSDVRWASFAGADGKGVCFRASEPMFVQALRCGWEDLEFARHRRGDRRIRSRLVPDDWTNLNLDIRQLGLGAASCGNNPPLDCYRFPIEKTSWTLVFKPLSRPPEVTWSIMHPTAIDVDYMKRVIAKAAEYGGVDSFEICGLEQKGVNALLTFERYPHVAAQVDRAFVAKTRASLSEVCKLAHAAGKRAYFWHRENLVPKGLFEDVPEILDADGEFDMLGTAYDTYLRGKIADTFAACPELDGLVLTLTESEYSVLHNSNQARYPAVEVVHRILGIFNEELTRRGKRLILRSFGVGDDYAKIIAGASAAAKDGSLFEIETKVTQADFVPWLPINPYLKRTPPLALGAECDALGEYLGAGLLPAAQVARIRDYVAASRAAGVSRYAIRIDRIGRSIFDSAHEVNLAAYMRFIRDPQATADDVLSDYAAKRFGAAADEMVPLLKSELEMVRGMHYIASNLMFHTQPSPTNFKIAKAGGMFALLREHEPLRGLKEIWSILNWTDAPTHDQVAAEKSQSVALAKKGLATVEGLKGRLSADEYARQRRAFGNAVKLAPALRAYATCVIAYFEEMKAGIGRSARLEEAVKSAEAILLRDDGSEEIRKYRNGLAAYCRELLREYPVERAMRKAMERPGVHDFVNVGGIYDDGRVERSMHAAYPEFKSNRIVRHVGNNRYPNGRITVRLKAPKSARIDVKLDPDGPQTCDIVRSWADGVWTVSIGKKGADYPIVETIAAMANE